MTAALDRSGLTVRAVAKAAGIHEGHLSEIKSGHKSPDYRIGLALAQALATSLDDLVAGDWPRRPVPPGDVHPLRRLVRSDQTEFAAAAGISSSHLSQVIHGKKGISILRLAACARAGGVSVHHLAMAMTAWDAAATADGHGR